MVAVGRVRKRKLYTLPSGKFLHRKKIQVQPAGRGQSPPVKDNLIVEHPGEDDRGKDNESQEYLCKNRTDIAAGIKRPCRERKKNGKIVQRDWSRERRNGKSRHAEIPSLL